MYLTGTRWWPSLSTAAPHCSRAMYPSNGSYSPSLGRMSTNKTSLKIDRNPSMVMRAGPQTVPVTVS